MKVRMKTLMAGPAGVFSPREIADLPQAQAYALCEGGYAEQIESAVEAPVETATAPAQKRAHAKAAEPTA